MATWKVETVGPSPLGDGRFSPYVAHLIDSQGRKRATVSANTETDAVEKAMVAAQKIDAESEHSGGRTSSFFRKLLKFLFH